MQNTYKRYSWPRVIPALNVLNTAPGEFRFALLWRIPFSALGVFPPMPGVVRAHVTTAGASAQGQHRGA